MDAKISREFIAASARLGGTVNTRDDRGGGISPTFFNPALDKFRATLGRISSQSDRCRNLVSSVHSGLIFDARPNAFAWRHKGLNFVGVTSGLVHLLHHCCFLLMSCRGVLPQFGRDTDEEVVDKKTLEQGFDVRRILVENSATALRYGYPRFPHNEERFLFAYVICGMAIEYALLHEFGHILLRHADMAEMDHGVSVIGEAFGDDETDIPAQVRQMFEIQADNVAIRVSFRRRAPEQFSEAPEGHAGDYFLWSFAVDLLFWLFSQTRNSTFSDWDRTHPHPQLRSRAKFVSSCWFEAENEDWTFSVDGGLKSLSQSVLAGSIAIAHTWKQLELPGHGSTWMAEGNWEKAIDSFDEIIGNSQGAMRNQMGLIDDELYTEVVGRPLRRY